MLRFKGTELRPILAEAKANGCKVILVKGGHGVYMISAIGEPDSYGGHKKVVYAIGCNPNVDDFDEWRKRSKRELGCDDIGEYFDVTAAVFVKLLNGTDDLIVRATQTHIHLETATPLPGG